MNWDHLRYFALVAEHGSVAAAGRSAGVSHATILRAVQKLEAELGLRLFDHLRTGYRLTPEGAELCDHVRRMSIEADGIERKAQGKGDEPVGELTLSLPEPDIIDLTPMIKAFVDAYPGLSVDIRIHNDLTPTRMLGDDIRMAFVLTNDPPEDLVGRKVHSITFCVASHIDADPADSAWIEWPQTLVEPQQLRRLRGGGEPSRHDVTVGTYSTALRAATAGLGETLIARSNLDSCLVDRRGNVEAGLWMLTHPEFRSDARVRAMMAFAAGRNQHSRAGGESPSWSWAPAPRKPPR